MSGTVSDTHSAGPMVRCEPGGQAVLPFGWAAVPPGSYTYGTHRSEADPGTPSES